MKLQNIDYSLYLVTDRGLARGRSTLDIVKAAVLGGVTCVQLREKDCSTLEFIEQALSVKDYVTSPEFLDLAQRRKLLFRIIDQELRKQQRNGTVSNRRARL